MKVFAWAAFLLAVIAGAGLSATAAGLVQLIVALALLTVLVVDITKDRVPNLGAVVVAVALPSLIVGMHGKLAEKIGDGLAWLWGTVERPLGEWAGTTTTLGIAVAALTVSFFVGRGTMSSGGLMYGHGRR